MITAEQYRELFRLRAVGELEPMECTKRLRLLLKPFFRGGMSILDVPCGAGHYYRHIRSLGPMHYTGMDLDEKCVELAKDIWKYVPLADFFVHDIAKDPLTFTYDIVFCYNLLLHLPHYAPALEHLFHATKTVLIVRALFGNKEERKAVQPPDDYLDIYKQIHYNTYSKDEITKYLWGLGECRVAFVEDYVTLPQEKIRKQAEKTGADPSAFERESDFTILMVRK